MTSLTARWPWLWPLVRPGVRRFFSERADAWESTTGAGSPEHLAAFAAGLLHVDGTPERVLDLGCGTGVCTLMLAREYPRASVRGVDISDRMIGVAKAKTGLDPQGRIAFRVADAARLPYADESFDLVTQLNVPVFASEVARVLRPGAYFLVATSKGSATPFHTDEHLLSDALERSGLDLVQRGQAAGGEFTLARRAPR